MLKNKRFYKIVKSFKYAFVTALAVLLSVSAYSSTPESITVLADDDYLPYIFRDDSGNLQGIVVDHWKLWSSKTGIKVKINAMDWSKALDLMNNGKGDVIDTLFYSEERAKIFDYLKPYAKIDVPVFFDRSISGLNSIDSLKGFFVGVKDGDSCIDVLLNKGITTLRKYPGYEAIIKDASMGNLHVFCADKPPALFYIYKYNIEKKFRYSIYLYSGQFHRAVLKGNSSLLTRGFELIEDEEYEEINQKWFGSEIRHYEYVQYILPAITVIAGIVLVLFLLNIYLRRKVVLKTSEVSEAYRRLKESESETRALLLANPDMLFVFDRNGIFLDYNAEETDDLYLSPGQFIGKNIKDVLAEDVAELTVNKIDAVMRTGNIQTYDYDLVLNGVTESFESRMVPFGEDKFLAIVRNISDKRKREDEAIRYYKLESLGIFAGGLAHDLNNILTAILGNVSITRMSIDDRQKSLLWLERSEKAVLRARNLTEQLRAFARGGAPVKEMTFLPDVVMEYADFALSGSGTAIEYDIEDNLPEFEVDRGQIGQFIQNIVLNSIQSMHSGGKIAVSVRMDTFYEGNPHNLAKGKYIIIELKDEGEGIEKEALSKIFDPYFTTKKDGGGLGLSISHSIIQRHGGIIKVNSEIGRGTVFYIYLPVSKERDHRLTTPGGNYTIKEKSNLNVLIMDDEVPLQMVISEVLIRFGAVTTVTSSGEELIDAFDRMNRNGTPADLVISDLTIPGKMGGREAIHTLRKREVPFKAIVISGYSNDPVISEYREHGFDGYLIKPFTAEELISAVEKVLEVD